MDAKKLGSAIEAKRVIAEGALTLWNARLEALIAVGDPASILDHIRAPIEDRIDNCGCNVQCGASQIAQDLPVLSAGELRKAR